uniref:Wsv119-like protein n=1 Tax=Sicyonia whispovirus TaxID=2984283 RepID=A0A9C7BX38_9VIRU|nr:MAG: wsv119-like protein [Sicyonia whispovirus]
MKCLKKFVKIATELVNGRLGRLLEEGTRVKEETIRRLFEFDEMDPESLEDLCRVLRDETAAFPAVKMWEPLERIHLGPGRSLQEDEDAVATLVREGFVSFEWSSDRGGSDAYLLDEHPSPGLGTRPGPDTGGYCIGENKGEEQDDGEKGAVDDGENGAGRLRWGQTVLGAERDRTDDFSRAFAGCLSTPEDPSKSRELLRPDRAGGERGRSPPTQEGEPRIEAQGGRHQRGFSRVKSDDLYVCFNVDRLARHSDFPELKVVPLVARYVVRALDLQCVLETMPVKPSKQREGREIWCQTTTRFENASVRAAVANCAKGPVLARRNDAPDPQIIRVFFGLDDSVDLRNPWGSCPLLHTGPNFRTKDMSSSFEGSTGKRVSKDSSEETCFVYAQKNPTLEIPSKIVAESEMVMRGVILRADELFHAEGFGVFTPDDSLGAAMAFSHPKARVRNVTLFYLSTRLPLEFSKHRKTNRCARTNKITLGRDAAVSPPASVSESHAECPIPQGAEGPEVSAGKEQQQPVARAFECLPGRPARLRNTISRKMSISGYRCLACRGSNNRCPKTGSTVAQKRFDGKDSAPGDESGDVYEDHSVFREARHLSHGNAPCPLSTARMPDRIAAKLKAVIDDASTSEVYFSPLSCRNTAICHNFFCRGIQPVSTAFGSAASKKRKFILYGKTVDTLGGFTCRSKLAPSSKDRTRVFYSPLHVCDTISDLSPDNRGSPIAYRDMMVYHCSPRNVSLHADAHWLDVASMGRNHPVRTPPCFRPSAPPTPNLRPGWWWLELNYMHESFAVHVGKFLASLDNLPACGGGASPSKPLFQKFGLVCREYKKAKEAILASAAMVSFAPDSTEGSGRVENEIETEKGSENEAETEAEAESQIEAKAGDEDENETFELVYFICSVLKEFRARDDAITDAMMHKSVLLGSRTFISGARCILSNRHEGLPEFQIKQYVVAMGGSAVAKVSEADLKRYTPVSGAVSAATAPNNRLPDSTMETCSDSAAAWSAFVSHESGSPGARGGPDSADNWRVSGGRELHRRWEPFECGAPACDTGLDNSQVLRCLALRGPVASPAVKYVPPHKRLGLS